MSENKWAQAFLATTAISVLPNCLLFLIPSSFFLAPAKGKKNLINWTNLLLCFAVAGLLGDVFIHILPHLMGTHSHGHGHDHGHGGAHAHDEGHHHESFAESIGHMHEEHHHDEHEFHELNHNDHDHGHDHHEDEHHHHGEEHEGEHHHHESHTSHEHKHEEHEHDERDHHRSLLTTKSFYDMLGLERSLAIQTTILFGFFVFFLAEKIAKSFLTDGDSHHHHGEEKNEPKTPSNAQAAAPKGLFSKIAATGWLNLLADSMHNFTDGIAIGAAYVSGRGIGLATCISVILHEIPHEIGDFTILIQSGLSKTQAIQAQFITAIAAFAGTLVGLLAERNEIFEDLLLAFTSGGFIYIATVSSIPIILQEKSSMAEIFGLCIMFALGIYMMILVAQYE